MPGLSRRIAGQRPVGGESARSILGTLLLRKRRQLQLSRATAAMRMSVDERTICSWECDREPAVSHYPTIIEFLGRVPWQDPKSLPEKLVAGRRTRGLTIEAAAASFGVDASTWWWWEAGRKPHRQAHRVRLGEFIGDAPAAPTVPTPAEVAPIPAIGRMLRDRRQVLGLTQRRAASELHVNEFTLMKWELDRHAPSDRYYPTLIRYLGQEPWPEPGTFGERIRAQRLRHGMTVSQLAGLIRVDESSLADWERGSGPTHRSSREKVAAFVEGRPLVRPRRKVRAPVKPS
jgi:transcriptional regulator with XRE-family HTH domain